MEHFRKEALLAMSIHKHSGYRKVRKVPNTDWP